jgi:hypothetical protein
VLIGLLLFLNLAFVFRPELLSNFSTLVGLSLL